MQCPYCGAEMRHGNITGGKILRLMPDTGTPKKVHSILESATREQIQNGIEGTILDVPYSGLAPWIPADFCEGCKKIIFETEMIE